MIEIVGIRFKSVGKVYYFAPGDICATVGDRAIVETIRGIECGEVVIANRQIDDSEINSPLKPIIRLATSEDIKIVEKNKIKEQNGTMEHLQEKAEDLERVKQYVGTDKVQGIIDSMKEVERLQAEQNRLQRSYQNRMSR